MLAYCLWRVIGRPQNAAEAGFIQGRLAAVVDNIVDGLITIDENGIVLTYNKACENIFGYQASEVTGKNIRMLMPKSYADHHDQYLKNYRDTSHKKIIGIGREVEGRRKDGSTFPLDLSVAEVKVGSKRFFSGIVRDITARKNAEKELRRSNEELEKFAYVASHDLKAPLRNIDDLAKWVVEDTKGLLPADAEDKLRLLNERVADLEALLDDILSYSRAGRIVDDPVRVDMQELVMRLVQTHVPDPPFKVQIKGQLPVVFSSQTPLEQIFGNLLSNAVKHHDLGKGVITVESFDDGVFYEIVVRDDGPGIPPEYHDRAFQMFQTLQSRDKIRGSGLGLSIIKKLVEWQGGRVWIESDGKTRGTAIHFTWPKNTDVKRKVT